ARGLPRWERIGHPLDTLTVVACYAWLSATQPSRAAMTVYVVLAVFSSLFVTKDEPIHRRLCTPAECWLHGVLFIVHPVVLACFAWAWTVGALWVVHVQLVLTLAVLVHQVLYWNVGRARVRT